MAHVSVFLALLVLFHDKFIFQSKACDSCHMTQKSVNFNDFAVVTVREMIIKLKRKKKAKKYYQDNKKKAVKNKPSSTQRIIF